MFWKFLIVAAIAFGIFQLGALSAWVVVLQALLVLVLAVGLGIGLLVAWRRHKS